VDAFSTAVLTLKFDLDLCKVNSEIWAQMLNILNHFFRLKWRLTGVRLFCRPIVQRSQRGLIGWKRHRPMSLCLPLEATSQGGRSLTTRSVLYTQKNR